MDFVDWMLLPCASKISNKGEACVVPLKFIGLVTFVNNLRRQKLRGGNSFMKLCHIIPNKPNCTT